MRYVGLSLAELLRLHLSQRVNMSRYFVRHIVRNRAAMKATRALWQSRKGKSAFVFANGPSIGILDPRKVREYCNKGFDVIAVNSYINSPFAKFVRPNYYVLSDPAHFGRNQHLLTETRRKQVEEDLEKLRSCNTKVFVPVQFHGGGAGIETYPFCDSENLFSDNVSDILRPRGYQSMTAYKALSIALYLGYDRIYVCGFDNNYFKSLIVDGDNTVYFADEHFYDGKDSPKVLHKIRDLDGRDLGEVLYNYHFLFKDLAKFSNFPIVNLDVNGLVDSFSKKHDLDVYL